MVKKFVKKIIRGYFNALNEMYGPVLRDGINPFI